MLIRLPSTGKVHSCIGTGDVGLTDCGVRILGQPIIELIVPGKLVDYGGAVCRLCLRKALRP